MEKNFEQENQRSEDGSPQSTAQVKGHITYGDLRRFTYGEMSGKKRGDE